MRALVLVLLLSATPHVAMAQEPRPPASARYIGKPIVSVALVAEGRAVEDRAVMDLIQTRVGELLSMDKVRESISHLFSLRRYQDIQVDATTAEGGVALVYDLVPLHGVEEVEFSGTLGLSTGLLRRTVTDRFGVSPPVGRAPEVARILEEQLYPDHGYLKASVKPIVVEEHDPDRTLLTFQIDSGPRARIGSVTLNGEVANPQEFLREIGAVTGAPYAPLTLFDELSKHAEDLRNAQRYEATADFRPVISGDRTIVDLNIEVRPGPIVTVRFEGDPLPEADIDELVPLEREDSAHEDLIEDSERRIRTYLAQQGYWKASVTSRSEEAEDRRTIVFTVKRGPQYRIAEDVEVRGASSLPPAVMQPLLEPLRRDHVFVSANLEAAVSALEAAYRERGFAQVQVDAAANELNPTSTGVGQVKPVIIVTEGPLTRVGGITFKGNAQISEERLRALLGIRTGDPFVVPRLVDDRERILLEYLNEGYASAEIQVQPVLSADGTQAAVVFTISEGQQTLVDHILIVGNTATDAEVIRRELLFRPGEPLGLADLVESRRRIAALGLFRRVQISELSHSGSGEHDVLVSVEEAPRTTLSYGGGLEASRLLSRGGPQGDAEERLEFAPRGFFDIGRRNLGGKNRTLNLYTRVSLRLRDRDGSEEPDADRFGFIDYRVVATYREPQPLGVNGDLTVTGALEQGRRTSFNFARKGVTAELQRRLAVGVRASARYSFATTRIYDAQLEPEEQALIDRGFPRVRLSTVAAAISRDTRDDVLEPTRGTLLALEGSVASRALGGQVGFLKSYGQALWFVRLPGPRDVVFASRMALGLADGFPRTVQQTGPDGEIQDIVVEDLPASERFFAGGDTTIRGFTLDRVGTPDTISAQGFPHGGNAVLLLNGELRVPVWGSVGAAFFVDGGNVFSRVSEFDLGELRGSIGFGVRYRSPLGPIRLDLGFKMDRRDNESGRAFHFSFGQAF